MVQYKVQSVRGDLAREQLGSVLMHEHVFVGYPGWDEDTHFFGPDPAAGSAG